MIVHTSDLHIGAFTGKPLANATISAFEEIASYVIDKGFKYFVIAGDFFEYPRLENYGVVRGIVRILRELRERGVYVVSVPGSHDSSPKGHDWLSVLRDAGLVHIPGYEDIGRLILYPLELGDIVFYGLPGLKNNYEIEYLKNRKVLFKDIEKHRDKHVVLIAHTSVEFAGYNPSDYSQRYGRAPIASSSVLSAIPDTVEYVALGHIHYPLPPISEGYANIAYPGAPIGRDLSDLMETIEIRKKGLNRRFLIVEPGEKTRIKSIWSSFGVEVYHYKLEFSDKASFFETIKKSIREHRGTAKYPVLVFTVYSREVTELSRIISELRSIEKKDNVSIYLRHRRIGSEEEFMIPIELGSSIEEIELKAIKNMIEKLGLKLDPDTVKKLLDVLSTPKPVSRETTKREFYAKLFREVKSILEGAMNEQ
ncbi:MAG: DNA repair exonuclease [Thermoprotei archaeon]